MTHTFAPARPRRGFRRLLTVLGVATAALALGTGTAMAHVTVNPGETAAGGYTKLTFRVPNESKTDATTDSITITLPSDTPFASVRAKQTPGWTAELVKTTLPAPVEVNGTNLSEAVTTVIFTADPGYGIGVGEFGEFDLSVGPVPETDVIYFPTVQNYSDGSVSEWTEIADGHDEPAHPAPKLTIAGKTEGHSHGGASVEAKDHQDSAGESTNSGLALTFGIIGTVVGLVGLGVALATARRKPVA